MFVPTRSESPRVPAHLDASTTPRIMRVDFAIALCLFAIARATRAAPIDLDFTASIPVDASIRVLAGEGYESSPKVKRPLVVYLHGFCLDDDAQQALELSSTRALPAVRNRAGFPRRRAQTLVQTGLREAVLEKDWLYAAVAAPHTTTECVLCHLQERSPNSQDRLFNGWITGILERDSPQFQCRAWDATDAVANPERGGSGDDVRFVAQVVAQVKRKFAVDDARVFVVGVGTGGFMASRLACERPDLFRGVVSVAGGTHADSRKCRPSGAAASVLFAHGTDDHTVPIAGGENSRGVAFPSAKRSFEIMGAAMGCDGVVVSSDASRLPAEGGAPEIVVERNKYGACRDGVDVEQWLLNGVDHFFERATSEELFSDIVDWMYAR